MVLKKLNKEYPKFISSSLNLVPQKSKFGILYTLYYDRFNLIDVGFAENDTILINKLLRSDLILYYIIIITNITCCLLASKTT